MIVGFRASTQPTISAIALVKGSDLPLILASLLHPRLQLKVQSGFWLVLPEKSYAGFPVVNPAYGDRRSPFSNIILQLAIQELQSGYS
ncbi:hypothetical protein LC612_24520 [Nostoc sp. CHAB 5834]|nr:hypothetical protein [Nostoc sp. CHAB 5834]